MAIRKRTTKLLAKRHDLNYFKKGSPIRTWQFKLALVAIIAAVVWIGLSSAHSAQAFSSGPISSSHAVFGQKCETCHKPIIAGAGFLPVGLGSARKVPDSACESCHTVGLHHANQTVASKQCSTCHIEHVGAMHLATAPVSGCTQCHANLEVKNVPAAVATKIDGFTKGHPDFRALRTASPEIREAAFGLKFNHADHLKKDLTGNPTGEKVTLHCEYCHQVEDPAGRDTAGHALKTSGRMANVSFERSCQSCHSLDFSAQVKEQAPTRRSRQVPRISPGQDGRKSPPATRPHSSKPRPSSSAEKCALCHTAWQHRRAPRDHRSPTASTTPARLSMNASFSPTGDFKPPSPRLPTIAPSHAPAALLHRRPLQPHLAQHRPVRRVPRRRPHQHQWQRSPDAQHRHLPALPRRPEPPPRAPPSQTVTPKAAARSATSTTKPSKPNSKPASSSRRTKQPSASTNSPAARPLCHQYFFQDSRQGICVPIVRLLSEVIDNNPN